MKIFSLLTKVTFLLLTVVFTSFSFGQNWQDKISWSFKLEKVDDSHATIVATAKLINGWHVFSVNHDPSKADFTGVPTTFIFPKSTNYKLIGKLMDGTKATTHVDELGTSLYFEGKGVFKQKIEILTDKAFDLIFEYSFQICDENGCIFPPDQETKLKVAGFKPAAGAAVIDVENNTGNDTPEPSGVDTVSKNVDTPIEEVEEVFPSDTNKSKPDINLWIIFFTGFA